MRSSLVKTLDWGVHMLGLKYSSLICFNIDNKFIGNLTWQFFRHAAMLP